NVQVTATIETLKGLAGAGAAEMEFSLPISSVAVQRMACDCSVTRILLSQESLVIDIGRSKRVISGPARKALSARDGHCRWPGCVAGVDGSGAIRLPLLVIAAACAAAVAGLTVLVRTTPYIALDDAVAKAIQSLDLGPLAAPFPFFRWAGGPGGPYMAAATIALVLLFNRRAWLLAILAIAGGVWYEALLVLAQRPRPTADQVLRITEHPGA